MAYAALDDLRALCGDRELIQLTDRADPPSDQVDEALALQALDEASAIIDSYVFKIYALPLASPPPLFRGLCCDIARYRLYRDPTEGVKDRHKAAIAALMQIAKGEAAVADAAGGQLAGRDDVVLVETRERVFSRDALRGF